MERESEAEPVDLLILLRHAHREIKLLLKEMEDILDLPAAIFELYPRIQVALQAHDAGEKYCLYAAMRDIPEFSDLLTMAESEHAEIDRMLDVLNHTPFRKQQLDSPEWKHKFRELHRKVLDHLSREEGEIFPLLQTLLAQSRLDALGDRYKRGLKGELGPPPARSEVIA